MSYKKILALVLSASSFCALATPHLNVWCDIHGVLLHEDVASMVKQRVMEKLAASKEQEERGLKDNPLFRLLCKKFAQHKPLEGLTPEKDPAVPFTSDFPLPFETFALFSGMYATETIQEKTLEMLEEFPCEDAMDQLMLVTLIEVLFDRKSLTDSMVPLPEGAALLKFFLAKENCTVRIYSNAPASWVALYPVMFPELFDGISEEQLQSSGKTSILKPLKEAFDFMKAQSEHDDSVNVLIDDTSINCAAAQKHGFAAVHFDYKKPAAAIVALQKQGIISDEEAITLLASCTVQRTTRSFGEPILFTPDQDAA
jgi:hypothetical protein